MKKIIFIFAIVILSLLPLNILHSEGITFITDHNIYRHDFREGDVLEHHAYNSLEILDNQLLSMMGWTQTPLGASSTFAYQSYFILTLKMKNMWGMPYSYVKLDLKNFEGMFLSDKYWINDRTLRLVFVSLMDWTLWIKTAQDSRNSYSRTIAFADIDFDKIPTDDVETFPQGYYYLMTAKTLNNNPAAPSPLVKQYRLRSTYTPEEVVFYVKELDELRTIRFTEGQHWTLRANLQDEDTLLSYDTLEHKAIDTTDYPATPDLMAQKQENDIVRYTYNVVSNSNYNYPGIDIYHRTNEGNLVFIKQVERQLHDTLTYQNSGDRRENRSALLGYQLFVFNNEGLLLYDTLFINKSINTNIGIIELHWCDDGFDALLRNYKTGKYQVCKYNFQGEEISKFDIDFTNVLDYNNFYINWYFTNDNIYFIGSSSINGHSETAYKLMAKYDRQGNFIASTKWDYNNPNVTNSTLRAMCVDNDTIYAFGSHVKNSEHAMAYIAQLYDEPVGISEPTILNTMAYPNPTAATSTLTLDLEEAGDLTITLNNLLGQEISTIYNGFADAGAFTRIFSIETLPKGIYYLKILHGGNIKIEKVIKN